MPPSKHNDGHNRANVRLSAGKPRSLPSSPYPLRIQRLSERRPGGSSRPKGSLNVSAEEPRHPTPAELQREKRLRADPLAEVLGPLWIDCRRCKARIKLSPKCAYDPFHWTKHRERCLKRSDEAVAEIRREQELVDASQLSSVTSSSHSREGTPSLTPDDDEERQSSPLTEISLKEETPPPTVPLCTHRTPSPAPLLAPDPADSLTKDSALLDAAEILSTLSAFTRRDTNRFDGYLRRSRRHAHVEETLPSPERWQEWSWGTLKQPVWVLAQHPKSAPVGMTPMTLGVDAGNPIGLEGFGGLETRPRPPLSNVRADGGGVLVDHVVSSQPRSI